MTLLIALCTLSLTSSSLALAYGISYHRLRLKLSRMGKHLILVDDELDHALEYLTQRYDTSKGNLVYASTVLMRNALESDSVSFTKNGESATVNVSPTRGMIDFSIKVAKK